MGWWDVGILGGDPPLDVLGDLSHLLKVRNDKEDEDPNDYGGFMLYPLRDLSDGHKERLTAAINENWPEIVDLMCKYCNGSYLDRGNIAVQVVATVVMAAGAPMPEDFRKVALMAGESDEWAQEDPDRERAIEQYIESVESYEGEAIELPHSGLFEKMAEKLGV